MGTSNSAGACSAILFNLVKLEYELDLGLLSWFLLFFLFIQSWTYRHYRLLYRVVTMAMPGKEDVRGVAAAVFV